MMAALSFAVWIIPCNGSLNFDSCHCLSITPLIISVVSNASGKAFRPNCLYKSVTQGISLLGNLPFSSISCLALFAKYPTRADTG